MSRLSSAGPSQENATVLPSGEKAGVVSAPGRSVKGRMRTGESVPPVWVECTRQYNAPAIIAIAAMVAATLRDRIRGAGPTTWSVASSYGRDARRAMDGRPVVCPNGIVDSTGIIDAV